MPADQVSEPHNRQQVMYSGVWWETPAPGSMTSHNGYWKVATTDTGKQPMLRATKPSSWVHSLTEQCVRDPAHVKHTLCSKALTRTHPESSPQLAHTARLGVEAPGVMDSLPTPNKLVVAISRHQCKADTAGAGRNIRHRVPHEATKCLSHST